MPSQKYEATSWKKSPAGHSFDLEVPSGQLCRVRRVSMEGLVKANVLNEVDQLTGLVSSKFLNKEGKIDVDKIMGDMSSLSKALEVVDRVVCHVVLEPPVFPSPAREEDRHEDKVYIDDIGMEDKMFIFQFAIGGTKDLEQFRRESEKLMGDMELGADMEEATK